MDKYISQEWLINAIKDRIVINTHPDPILSMMQKHECQEVLQLIESAPAADVAPVRPGKWVDSGIACEEFVCSVCGGAAWYYDERGTIATSNYCPNCGAKMNKNSNCELLKVETNIYDKVETVEGCTVQILTNTATGDTSVGWWRGSAEDMPGKENDHGKL